MKGTQLWQEAGSPIIHGRSRRLRPFWQAWGVSAVVGVLALAVVEWVVRGGTAASSLPTLLTGVALGLPGLLVGCAVGVWAARSAGWRGAWVYGLLCGVAFGLLSVWLLGSVVKV